jgi:hypothetical protein
MIKHVAMFKLKQRAPEHAGRAVEALESLRGNVAALLDLEVGVDIKGSPLSYDVVATARFADARGLAEFSADPRHKAVVLALQELCAAVAIVDYEIAG